MLKSMKVSIIVPIYNTGKYLNKCIDSILTQKLDDFELILINDGSKDNSGEICDEFAKLDSRVKVIHKSNEGVSVARNTGISVATGEFIGFIDSDDWIEPDMFYDMYNCAINNDADVVMCDAITKYEDKCICETDTIDELKNSCILYKYDINPKLLLNMAGAVWRCIYKRELLINNLINFPSGIPISEDRIFNIYAFGFSNIVYYIKQPYYNRFIRAGSAVTGYRKNMIDCVITARYATMKALDDCWDGDNNYKLEYEKQTVALAYASINNEFYKQSKDSFKTKFKNIKEICKNNVIRNSVKLVGNNDIRTKLIMSKNALILGILAFVLNKIHKR